MGDFIDPMLNERLLTILSTTENVNLATLGFEHTREDAYEAIITPIEIAGERLGTLFLYKVEKPYDIDDIILCEYGTTVVGLKMLRAVTEESAEALLEGDDDAFEEEDFDDEEDEFEDEDFDEEDLEDDGESDAE